MNKALKELTNIGVPVYKSIELPIQNMTGTCSDHIGKTITLERDIRKETIDRIEKVVGKEAKVSSRDYLTDINFFANDNSTSVFDLDEKQRIINVSSNLIDKEKLEGKTTKEVLEKLKKEKEQFYKLLDYTYKHPYTRDFHKYMRENYVTFYAGSDVRFDLRGYMRSEYNFNEEFEKKLDEVFKIDFTDLLDDYTNDLNPEKVALYLAKTYMDEIYKSIITNDTSRIQECLFYLTAFIKNKIDRKIKLNIDRKEINYDSIKQEYESLLIRYPFLREIKYKRSFFENKDKEDNLKVIDSLINMEKVYVKETFVKPGPELNIKVKDGTHRRRNTPPTEEELREIQEYLDYKMYVFLKNNPIAQIECPNKFSNYIAFLYENGMMPADRFHNVNTIEQMKADSIYVFDDLTYEEMMQYNKQYLRQNMETKPLNHSGDWEGRVEHIATKETSQEMRDKAKQIVKNKTN